MKLLSRIEGLFSLGPLGGKLYFFIYRIGKMVKSNWMSDERHIKKSFRKWQGYKLDLSCPTTLNEKLCFLKLTENRDIYTITADKLAVRDYVKAKVGEKYLIPLLAVFESENDVKHSNLPNEPFILKMSHDSGSYIIVRNKEVLNLKLTRGKIAFWRKRNYYWIDRERQYKNVRPRILLEKLLLTESGRIPNDYKLNCINGKVEFIYISLDREGVNKRAVYTPEWKLLPITWARSYKDLNVIKGDLAQRPLCLDEMIYVAECLSKDFPYARIDLYEVKGVVYFGEITHYHGGGYDQMRPFEYDQKFGQKIELNPWKN